MYELRQSTARTILIGPFLDDTDGKTPETALDVTTIDCDLYKGSTKSDLSLTASGGDNDCVHVANGYYSFEITTGNSDTLANGRLSFNVSGAMPFWEDFMVVSQQFWDSKYSTDVLQVDVTQWSGTAVATPTTAGVPEVEIKPKTHCATSGTINTGSVSSGVYTDACTDDTSYWVIRESGTNVDVEFGFGIGTNRVPTSVSLILSVDYVSAGTSTFYAYNYLTSAWEQINYESFDEPGTSDTAYRFSLLQDHGDTDGSVKIKIVVTGFDAVEVLNIDLVNVQSIDAGSIANGVKLGAQGMKDVNAEADTALSDYGANTTTPPTATAIVNEWETQSQADPTGFHVNVMEVNGTGQTANDMSGDINDILADTNELELDWKNGGRLDNILDTLALEATVAALENISAANVETACDASLVSMFTSSAELVHNVWDRVLTGATHNVSNSAGRRLRELGAYVIAANTAQAGAAGTITLAATESATNHIYNRNLVVIMGGTGIGQTRTIVDYIGATKVCHVDRPWWTNPDNTSEYTIVPDDTPLVTDHGLAQAGANSTITLRASASAISSTYQDQIVQIMAGTGAGQARLIDSYVGATKVATIHDTWTTNPDATSIYALIPSGLSHVVDFTVAARAAINAECDTAVAEYDGPTNTEMEARTLPSADYVVTTDTIAGVTTVTNLTNAPTSGDLTATMKTSVNDQVVDVIRTDTTSEMSQGAPPATPTIEEMMAYVYFKMRNKQETTASEDAIYDNAGTTKLFKTTISDNGTTFTKQEYGSGA